MNVKASDFAEQLGLTQEELDEMLEEDKTLTFEIPYTYEETGRYVIEEEIGLNTSGVSFYWEHYPYVNYVSYGTVDLAFGSTKLITNLASLIEMTLYNDDQLLFNKGGTLYLKLVAYSTKGKLHVYRSGGTETITNITTDPTDVNAMTEIEIDNSLANITKIKIVLNGPVKQGTGDSFLCGGVVKYGYTLSASDDEAAEENSKNIFELLQSFIGGFWTNIQNKITSVFSYLETFISDFWTSFSEKIESGFDYLVEGVIGIFIPSDDYINEWLSEYYNLFKEKFGALGYVQSYIVDLFTTFYSAEVGDPVLTFPKIEIKVPNYGTYLISNEMKINLNNLVKDIPLAVDMLHFATSIIMALSIFEYGRKTLVDILNR